MQYIALDVSYQYDVRGQLLEERRNGASVCYAYDKAGNRVRKTDEQGETHYFYNEKNQLTRECGAEGERQFTYDCQGGIMEEKNPSGIRLFSYNSRHQQTRVETENGNVQENRYDVGNLRFELLENGNRTAFVYHNGELLHEEGGEEKQTSYHLGAGISAFQRGQETYYYHRDEQLSTAFITGADGTVRNSYQYDAFGNLSDTIEQLLNRIRYTGQQYDELTGQYYLRARYYNPIIGRFMQEDTYQGDGLNLYAYCKNNPVVYYDPSGYMQDDMNNPSCVDPKFGEDEGNEGGSTSVVKTQKNVPVPVLPEGSQWERNVLNSFAGGKSTLVTYEGGTTLYRVGGKNGGFWSLDTPPATEYQWRVNTAIKQEFCNDGTILYKMTIPEGSSLTGLEGRVGSQGMGLYGGAHQVYIDYRAVPTNWIEISPTTWK